MNEEVMSAEEQRLSDEVMRMLNVALPVSAGDVSYPDLARRLDVRPHLLAARMRELRAELDRLVIEDDAPSCA